MTSKSNTIVIELCDRSLNTRRFEYTSGNVQWSFALAESATSLAERFLRENASSPLNVDPCYVALIQHNKHDVDCEDAMRIW